MEVQKENPRDRIRTYLESRHDLIKSTDPESLDFANPGEFEERMVQGVGSTVNSYMQIPMPESHQEGQDRPFVLLNKVILDESIPIALEVYKSAKYEHGRFICDQLYFKLDKGGEWLGEFVLRNYENEFRFSHRKMNPSYRGGIMSGSAIKAMDEFVKQYVKRNPHREAAIHSNAAQLDVISWFSKNGYEETDDDFPNPHGAVKMNKLEDILTSLESEDGNYTVSPGEYLYVFPGDFKGDHMLPGGTKADEMNMDEAALVHMKKELKLGESITEQSVVTDIDSAITQTNSKIEELIQRKGPIVIHVTGKSGAGKTVYKDKLGIELEQRGLQYVAISTDDYVEKIPGLEEYRHNMAKLASDIESAQRQGRVVIVEGIIPESSGTLSLESDYQVFFDAPFEKRMVMRMYREFASDGKSPEPIMKGVASAAGEDVSSFQKYESINPTEKTNLVVQNNYEMEDKPQLYISGDKFVFEAEGAPKTEIDITEEQKRGLTELGIRITCDAPPEDIDRLIGEGIIAKPSEFNAFAHEGDDVQGYILKRQPNKGEKKELLGIEKASISERIRKYLEDHPEINEEDGEAEKNDDPVVIENKDRFEKRMVSSIRKIVPKYLKGEGEKLLKVVRLDSSIPLDLNIYRRERKVDGDHVNNLLYFEIKKEGQEAHVAEFALRDYDNEFRFSHRKVHPDYRKNGIATFAMKAIEEFVKEYSRKVPGRKAVIEANAGQLDVLKYFVDNDFETTMDDVPVYGDENEIVIHNIEKILTDLEKKKGKYEVGEFKYVFPTEYEGPRFQKGEEEIADNIEIDESALVHFRKELNVESREGWLRKKARALLRRKKESKDDESPLPLYHAKLSEKLKNSPESLRFGPTYNVETSQGEPLTVSTVFLDNEAFKERLYDDIGRDNVTRLYFLIAQDNEGNIVGVTTMQVTFRSSISPFMQTFAQGKGISTPLSMVAKDVIQRYSNEINEPVETEVTNYNLRRLGEIREEARGKISDTQAARISDAEGQQERWKANWGNEGKLGLKDGKKVISPNELNHDLESIQSIDLQRQEGEKDKEILAVPVREAYLPAQKASIRKDHLERFKPLLDRMV